jgi:hypothetical protein
MSADPEALLQAAVTERPLIKVLALVAKATGHPSAANIPLESIVTGESAGCWDLMKLALTLQGMGLFTRVDYRSPEWAEVVVVDDVSEAFEPVDGHVYQTLSFYVRWVEELADWRVHALDRTGLSLDRLP